MLRRDSLRAQRDFYAPMTEGTQIRYAAAQTPVSGKYGAEVKKRLADIGSGVGGTAQRVGARKAEMRKTEDPTRSAQASFYAPMTEKKDDRLSKIAGAAQDAIGRGISQVTSVAGEAADQYRKDRQSTSEQIAGISQAFDKQYGALKGDLKAVKDQVSTVGTQVSQVKEEIKKKENTPKKAVEVATKAKQEKAKEEKPSLNTRRRGGRGGNSLQAKKKREARQNRAKALAKKRLSRRRKSSTAGKGGSSSSGGGTSSSSSSQSKSLSKRRRYRGGVKRRTCDLRCKVNISLLSSMNLMRDDLAEVAYFVKELQEIN